METFFTVAVAVLAVLKGSGVDAGGPPIVPGGCDSIQNVGFADCVLQSMYNADIRPTILSGNGSTVVYDRMELMTNIVKCAQGKSDHLPQPGRKRRAIDDAEGKVQLRLKYTLCFNDCQLEYGSMANAAPTCEIVDILHLIQCTFHCLDDKTAYRSYRPAPGSMAPGAYGPVNDDEFATMKNDYTIAYVKCILDEISAGPSCDSQNYLSLGMCQVDKLLKIKRISLSGGRRKRQAPVFGVTDDNKLYDRILNTACVMRCVLEVNVGPGQCYMEAMGLFNLCLNKCVRAVIDTDERLGIWHDLNNAP